MTIAELIMELKQLLETDGNMEVLAPDNKGNPGEAFVVVERKITPKGPKQVVRITS